MSESPVLVSVSDGVGRLSLNRPAAINALTHEMVDILADRLEAWRLDSEVAVVVIDGAGDRGLCAGGDVRELREHALGGRPDEARAFFRAEYRLNAAIARHPKPVVAIMDGITMGGGVGVSGHAAIRVVTERSRVAMPETRIGLVPDVGGTWLLARAPGELGTHLGLNSVSMDAADAIHAGFADVLVPSGSLPHLLQALAERADPGSPAEIALLFDETPGASELARRRPWIDACYSAPNVREIIERLAERPEPEARAAGEELAALSPTAVTMTLASIRAARRMTRLEDALEQEYRVSSWFIRHHDLAEGIRAQLIDKDRSPRWDPASLDAVVDPAEVLGYDPGGTVF